MKGIDNCSTTAIAELAICQNRLIKFYLILRLVYLVSTTSIVGDSIELRPSLQLSYIVYSIVILFVEVR